ncbi:MAG: hypothetical protein ABR501_08005 [Pyrinomonadaceae bacterium]
MNKDASETPTRRWNSRTKRDLIIEVWESLDCESVGGRELELIQHAIREQFGDGAVESPASIARTVADEGAVLRHPEVFTYDSRWRQLNAIEVSLVGELNFSGLSHAVESFSKIEDARRELQNNEDRKGLEQLNSLIAGVRKDCLVKARSKILPQIEREQAKEVSKWLGVWLQSPELFSDWLGLRRRSPEFRKRFGPEPNLA